MNEFAQVAPTGKPVSASGNLASTAPGQQALGVPVGRRSGQKAARGAGYAGAAADDSLIGKHC